MADDKKLSIPVKQPNDAVWRDDTDTHLIEVTTHDQRDIAVDRSYMILFVEDAESGRYICSNISFPAKTERGL